MMGKYIHDSRVINEAFDCHYINLATAKDIQDIGKVGVKKLFAFVHLLGTIRKEVKRLRPQLVYVTPNAKGGVFYKVVVHYHNKGVSTKEDRWLDNLLYKRFFKGVKVILLAEALYADIHKYVKRQDVLICPNGLPNATE